MTRLLLPLLLLSACDDTGKSGGGPGTTEVLADPCGGSGTPYAVTFTSDDEGWVGCGSGAGLWRTTDGGDTFERGHESGDLYVNAIVPEPSGDLLVCGHDYDGAGRGLGPGHPRWRHHLAGG